MENWLASIFALEQKAVAEYEALSQNKAVQDLIALGMKYLLHTPTSTGTTVVVEPKPAP